jgi:hypothetical protein
MSNKGRHRKEAVIPANLKTREELARWFEKEFENRAYGLGDMSKYWSFDWKRAPTDDERRSIGFAKQWFDGLEWLLILTAIHYGFALTGNYLLLAALILSYVAVFLYVNSFVSRFRIYEDIQRYGLDVVLLALKNSLSAAIRDKGFPARKRFKYVTKVRLIITHSVILFLPLILVVGVTAMVFVLVSYLVAALMATMG